MSTITQEQQEAIAAYLKDRHIPVGLGTKEVACSIAAINLVLTGKLTDAIPGCMSAVVGRWVLRIQDAMPDAMRNSTDWRSLLPLAAGTGHELESERLSIILDWMWGTVLPQLQPVADAHGYGDKWGTMVTERTANVAFAAYVVASAANAAYLAYAPDAAADAAVDAAYLAYAAAKAAKAADAAAKAADAAANAAYAAKAAYAANAAYAAGYVTCAADAAAATAAVAADAASATFWVAVDPPALLQRLIEAR
jgi:hypothetical protein